MRGWSDGSTPADQAERLQVNPTATRERGAEAGATFDQGTPADASSTFLLGRNWDVLSCCRSAGPDQTGDELVVRGAGSNPATFNLPTIGDPTMKTFRILDLFCGAGGCSFGYKRAADRWFKSNVAVVGVDLHTKNYPTDKGFCFIKTDALAYLRGLILTGGIEHFDFIHASPPCQHYSFAAAKHRNAGKEYVDLVEPTRVLLEQTGLPYVIENVVGAPLRKDLILCGEMFGLNVVRHRLFECSFPIKQPAHIPHKKPIIRPAKDGSGRMVKRSQYCCVAGNGGEGDSFKLEDWRDAMGIQWMTKKELAQAIPPVYTEYIFDHWFSNHGVLNYNPPIKGAK